MNTETYADVFSFLKLHTDVAELVDPAGGGRVLVAPELAGRVMTSSAGGAQGISLGWVNREAFVAPPDPRFTNYGAEERLWLGPEGGQFSLYFPPGTAFDLGNWYVPKAFNDEAYAVTDRDETSVEMCKAMTLRNWTGTAFELMVERVCRTVPAPAAAADLEVSLPDGVTAVAFETENALINRSEAPLERATGLVSIWLLGMLNATARTAVLIPYRTDEAGGSGPVATTDYFGAIPADRLVVADRCVVFHGDAKHRGKIGLGPARATDRLGSMDLEHGVLTVIGFTFAGEADYVNAAWKIQEEPYRGDVVNSYNDGPPPGAEKGFGAFYELESSSPARELAPGEKLVHTQRTVHFQGPPEALDGLARTCLGAGITEANLVLGA
jgi:hypothetical protein